MLFFRLPYGVLNDNVQRAIDYLVSDLKHHTDYSDVQLTIENIRGNVKIIIDIIVDSEN